MTPGPAPGRFAHFWYARNGRPKPILGLSHGSCGLPLQTPDDFRDGYNPSVLMAAAPARTRTTQMVVPDDVGGWDSIRPKRISTHGEVRIHRAALQLVTPVLGRTDSTPCLSSYRTPCR
jgi:hypothetical protein